MSQGEVAVLVWLQGQRPTAVYPNFSSVVRNHICQPTVTLLIQFKQAAANICCLVNSVEKKCTLNIEQG